MRRGQNVPRSWNSWTPRGIGNLQLDTTTLLVARTSNICEEWHARLWNMSTVYNQPITVEPGLSSNRRGKNNKTFRPLFHGPDYWPPTNWVIQLYPGRGRLRPFEGGNFVPLCKNTDLGRRHHTSARQSFQEIWTTWQNDLWQRPQICCICFPRTLETPITSNFRSVLCNDLSYSR